LEIYQPQFLLQIKEDLKKRFPSPQDYAFTEEDILFDIMDGLRERNGSFFELSATELKYSYQLSKICTEEEYVELQKVFKERITSELFDIGWLYCQVNPNNSRAVALFSEVCRWMKQHKTKVYDVSLIGRLGLPWNEIYIRSVEIMRIGKFPVEEFCTRFDVLPNTLFVKQLQLTYLSMCEKDELVKNESLLANLITDANIEFLRPAIKNYTAKIPYDDIPQLVGDAISYRISSENADETLGLSPNLLQRIRRLRFSTILEDNINQNSQKNAVYHSIAGMIRNVELLTGSFFAVYFRNYIVLESSEWKNHAYAYLPNIYNALFETWKEKNYPENYWPGMNEDEISDARNVVLGLKKSGVIKLSFTDFDILYTKDLLTVARY
jgi:hypothetical protein